MEQARRPQFADIQSEWAVYALDDQEVGMVEAVRDGYLEIEAGLFFPKRRYVPFAAIQRLEGERVYLTLTKDEAEAQDWDAEPMVGELAEEGTDADGRVTDQTMPVPGEVDMARRAEELQAWWGLTEGALGWMAKATASERDLVALGTIRAHVAAILDELERLAAQPDARA